MTSTWRDFEAAVRYLPTSAALGHLHHRVAKTVSYSSHAGAPDAARQRCPCLPAIASQSMDKLLTAEEIAERLNLKTDWVWAQARAGRIPHIRLGRYRRFRESAIEAWLCELEARSVESSAATPSPPIALRRRAS